MVKVGIMGFGTVGSGFYSLFLKNKAKLQKKYGETIEIGCILVRDPSKYASPDLDVPVTSSFEEFLNCKPQIVIEATGGVEEAFKLVSQLIEQKIHIISSNKDMVAEKGERLRDLAEDFGVRLLYEASVGGGIPILKPIRECLTGNSITSISSIINGTSNYILSKMFDEGAAFNDVLSKAQELGYAESNPSADVDGLDAARKLAIISTLAYGGTIDWNQIRIKGIRGVEPNDMDFARSLNCKIKLMAVSLMTDAGVYASVTPCFVKKNSYFGKTDSVYNGVMLEGDAVGKLMFSGRGAGSMPTASSVFSDLEDALETVVFGNEAEHLSPVPHGKVTVMTEYPNECEWVIGFDGSLESTLTEKILIAFEDIGLMMRKNPGWKTMYLKTGYLTESELNQRMKPLLESLENSDDCSIKKDDIIIYQIFE